MSEDEISAEERLRRIEYAILVLMQKDHAPVGICVNALCGYPHHPHWDRVNDRSIDWSVPIIR